MPRLPRSLLILAAGWLIVNLAGVLVRWGQAVLTPVPMATATLALDLRQDRSVPGVVVTLAATRPSPDRGDLFGHLWVIWPQTPPGAPPGSRAAGYYARSHAEAAGAMAVALLAPWGSLTGQRPVPGILKVDDGWWRHYQIAVRTDRAGLARALAVDSQWRRETRYTLRPGLGSWGVARTIGCQDYAFSVASALGLAIPARRDWTLFPIGSFRELLRVNRLEQWMDRAAAGGHGPAK